MSKEQQKADYERRVFEGFRVRSGLKIDQDSVENRPPPQPDILCKVEGKGHVAFELKRISAEDITRAVSSSLKTGASSTPAIRTYNPIDYIAKKARAEKKSSKFPMELVFYSELVVATPCMIIRKIQMYFDNDLHKYQAVWFMGLPGETCECVLRKSNDFK